MAYAQNSPSAGKVASQTVDETTVASSSVPGDTKRPADSGEIVVTAERRASSIQKTPISISAFSGGDLQKKGIASIEGLTGQIPAVAVNNESGTTKVNIRGLGLTSFGPGVEGPVAIYSGGVYLAHANEAGAAFLDVQRIEVLRGPQGTLYGRNSTGGAVNIIPNSPTDNFTFGGDLTYGNYQGIELNGYVSGAIVPGVLKARFALQYQRHDGYLYNAFNGDRYDNLKQGGFRATLEYKPSDRFEATLSADYYHGHDQSIVALYLGNGIQRRFADQLVSKALDPVAAAAAAANIVTVSPLGVTAYGGVTNQVDGNSIAIDPNILYQNTAPVSRRTYYGGALSLNYKITDEISIKSLTAYRRGMYSNLYDLDRTTGNAANYTQIEKWRQFSEELQILGTTGKINWIVGAYYLNDRDPYAAYIYETPPFGVFLPYGSSETRAYAAFAQATYSFTPELKLTLGGRYSTEKRLRNEFYDNYGSLVGPILPASVSFSKFTPKATIEYIPSRSVTLYATVAEGFKSGGFLITAAQGPIRPETLWDYEAGAKLRLFDNLAQLNLSAYHYDYKNIQVTVVNDLVFGVANAASATVNGAELELTVRPMRNLRLTASGSLIDGRFKEFVTRDPQYLSLGLLDLSGNRLPANSKWSYYLDAAYTIDLPSGASIEPEISWTWRGAKYFDAYNLKNAYQPAVGTIDARLRFTSSSGKWYLEGFGKNLTNEFIISQGYVSGVYLGGPMNGQREAPRTYGVRVGFNY